MTFWNQFQKVGEPVSAPIQEPSPESIPQSIVPPQAAPQIHPMQNFWGQYQKIDQPEEESGLQSFARQGRGVALKALSGISGLPGDVESLGRMIVGAKPDTILPTSASIQKEIYEKNPELIPKGGGEEFIQEMGGAVLQPGGLFKKLLIQASSLFAKDLVKELGGSEGAQTGAQVLTGILSSRTGKPNVKDFINQTYKKASAAIPKNAVVNAERASNYLSQVETRLAQGASPEWKKTVLDQVEALKSNITDGKIKVTALDESIKDLNNVISNLNPKSQREAIRWLTRVKLAAQHELKQYGKTNPEFWKHYKAATASFAGFKQSLIAQKQLENLSKQGVFKGSVGLLAQALVHPEGAVKTAGTLASLYGLKKSGELINRIFSNPTLANYYLKTIKSAAKENIPQVISNLSKLDKGLKKSVAPSDSNNNN